MVFVWKKLPSSGLLPPFSLIEKKNGKKPLKITARRKKPVVQFGSVPPYSLLVKTKNVQKPSSSELKKAIVQFGSVRSHSYSRVEETSVALPTPIIV